jgi:hypothetical protein
MPNLTSIADWAESLGISRQQGYAAVTRCEIPVVDGKVDVEYATMLYHRHTRQRANPKRYGTASCAAPTAGAGGGTGASRAAAVPGYETSRARREAAEAAQAEIKLDELAGRFLVKSEVHDQLFEIARSLRDGLMNCSRRIATEVAALASADECEDVIDREHQALLENMAHALSVKLKVDLDEGA